MVNLPAGRELDALVAQKVMGRVAFRDSFQRIDAEGLELWWENEKDEAEPARVLPRYSTDIAAAWQMVETMQSIGFAFQMTDKLHGITRYMVVFGFHGENYHIGGTGISEDAPHAICLAALSAVGYQGPIREGETNEDMA